jgi:hypothetical protein
MGDPTAEPASTPPDPADEERDARQEEADTQDAPDEDAGPAVEPIEGDQGTYLEQDPAAASGVHFDPSTPVRTSPPPSGLQEGVARQTGDRANEDVPPGGAEPASE